jgi:hypothetical protein
MWNEYELETEPYGDGQAWYQRELELRRLYEEMNPVPRSLREEERLDRRERVRDINSVGRSYI